MPEQSPAGKRPKRDRVVVLDGVDVSFAVDLPGTGPYAGKTVVDGEANLTERFEPHDEEWVAEPSFESGETTFRMVAEGPSENTIVELPDLGPEEVDDETGAWAEWEVVILDPDDLATADADRIASLLESTVGLFTAGEIPLAELERCHAALADADREDLKTLPEYEVLLATIAANRD